MAEVDEEAVTSGVLHGIEVAVAGGLISPSEVLGEEPSIAQVIREARAIADGSCVRNLRGACRSGGRS